MKSYDSLLSFQPNQPRLHIFNFREPGIGVFPKEAYKSSVVRIELKWNSRPRNKYFGMEQEILKSRMKLKT